jgi:hypothetical protein
MTTPPTGPDLDAIRERAANAIPLWFVARGPTGHQRYYLLDQYDQEVAELTWDADVVWDELRTAREDRVTLLAALDDARREAARWQADHAALRDAMTTLRGYLDEWMGQVADITGVTRGPRCVCPLCLYARTMLEGWEVRDRLAADAAREQGQAGEGQ